MAEENKAPDDDLEVIIEGEDDKGSDTSGADKGDADTKPDAKVEDARLRVEDDDDDDDDAVDGETPDQRAERRREERKRRKERQKKAEAEAKATIQYLREKDAERDRELAQLRGQLLKQEAANVDRTMAEAERRYNYATQMHSEAIAKGDGIGATKALEAQQEASRMFGAAQRAKAQLVAQGQGGGQGGQRQQRQQQDQGPDPRVVERARKFIDRHPWAAPDSGEQDAAIAATLDNTLSREGFDPRDDEFWTELERRAKKLMPHRFKSEQSRKEPPVAGGSDRATSGKKTFRLSKERMEAMKADGSWDDPVRRNAMIKRYAAYDAANANKSTR